MCVDNWKIRRKKYKKVAVFYRMHEKIYDSLYTIHSRTKEQSIFPNGCCFFTRSELPFLPLAIFPSLNQYKLCESIDYKIKSERKTKNCGPINEPNRLMKTAHFHHSHNKHREIKRKSENVTPKHIKLENLSLTILYHLWRRFNVQI